MGVVGKNLLTIKNPPSQNPGSVPGTCTEGKKGLVRYRMDAA